MKRILSLVVAIAIAMTMSVGLMVSSATDAASISVDKTTFEVGETITVNYTNAAAGGYPDWVAIYATGVTPSSSNPSIQYAYCVDGAGSSIVFNAPTESNSTDSDNDATWNDTTKVYYNHDQDSLGATLLALTVGTYDVYYLDNGGYTPLCEPITITIEEAGTDVPTDVPTDAPTSYVWVITAALNIRSTSDFTATDNKIGLAYEGDRFEVAERTDTYTKIVYADGPDGFAYISANSLYVTFENPNPDVTDAPTDIPTDIVTDAPTDAVTDAPTAAPIIPATSDAGITALFVIAFVAIAVVALTIVLKKKVSKEV